MFPNGGGSLSADVCAAGALGLPARGLRSSQMGLVPLPDLTPEQTASLMQSLDVDMMPMDVDLTNLDAPPSYVAQQQPPPPPIAAARAAPDEIMAQPGAGPLPTGFGIPNANPPSNTLTEFTKRRNWTQRAIEALRDFLHILTPDGRILYVSPSCKQLTGHDPSQLVGRFIPDFIHPDDNLLFLKEFNESIASGNSLRFFFRFRKNDDSWAIFEAHGHPHISQDTSFGPQSARCRGFFMMARPYPTKNASLLDSFLEHKIENERLMKRIAELKREEVEDLEAQERQWKVAERQASMPPSESQGRTPSDSQAIAAYNSMPPPARPGSSSPALTRQNLDEALAASKPDSINDKMARYEGANHLETIEMLTGLRYRDGERSQGISTGDASPVLIRGDAGIQISLDKERSLDKKKKLKLADEYVCTDCGTLDSPEWRKGPNGPKTLCNACGLRWAKKEKKRNQMTSEGQSHMIMPSVME